MKRCIICKKKVPDKEDPFTHFTVTDMTICKICKKRLEDMKLMGIIG